jgi:polyisoprenyl-teichoic acid--peptidoglycan teichoic acid transferase
MKKVFVILATVIILVISGSYFYSKSMLNKIPRTELPKTNEELGIIPETNEKPETNPQPGNSGPAERKDDIVNIVFFGVDARNPDEASRSDSIMVVSIDRKTEKVKVTSLMRDMYVPIPGRTNNRINAAYAFGGPALAIKTINSNFGLDVRNYVTIDFFGLKDLVDKVGGVDINIKSYEVERSGVSKPGLQTLNGEQALAYSRIRKVGNADYERTERQRRVLNELFKKIKAQGAVKLPGLVSILLPYVETSLANSEIIELALDAFKFDTENIEQLRIPVNGTFKSQTIRGMAVLVPDIEENKAKIKEFIYGK